MSWRREALDRPSTGPNVARSHSEVDDGGRTESFRREVSELQGKGAVDNTSAAAAIQGQSLGLPADGDQAGRDAGRGNGRSDVDGTLHFALVPVLLEVRRLKTRAEEDFYASPGTPQSRTAMAIMTADCASRAADFCVSRAQAAAFQDFS